MEVHPGMSYYNDVQDGTALVTKTLESTTHLTPLHIPPGPPVPSDRYEELRETFQLCKPVLKGGQESGGSEPMLPESHRIYEPPYKFEHEHNYYGNTRDAPLRYVKYKLPATQGTLLVAGRYRPFHPYVHGNVDITGGASRNEGADEPFDINTNAVERPGQHGSFHVSQFGDGNDQAYDPNSPKSGFKPPQLDISPRAANMLENAKKALWLTTYKRNYTGRGSMNPLLLDDYDYKVIGRTTGELGKDVELRESFPSDASQVRPLDGRIARSLQGRQFHISNPQLQDSANIYMLVPHCTDNLVTCRHSEGVPSRSQCPETDSGANRRTEYFLENLIHPQVDYQRENSQGKKLPRNRFWKITDTWKIENLYQRQLAVPPDPELLIKPADSIYYEDLPPSHLNKYIVWHHPVSLSKPALTHLSCEKPDDRLDFQCAPSLKEIVTSSQFPEWIPNCGVSRPQTKLLDMQDSFRKGEAIKRLSDLTRGGVRDLRDHNRQGRRHQFYGIHAHFFN
ncbi:sperm-associated microtubule inner protein 4 [Rhineura floridana]|uniref:sperm-associated microtubule inner protein 4 n=1 Tax=Rhineura floridana TaxID=261503 RepID=UPI002AC87C9D|nr:sperm-associated microtubule inner protein 4 [Rhineura floridana]